jgi:hypothetical protein
VYESEIHLCLNNNKYKYMYVCTCMCVHIGMYSVRKCSTQLFGAHPKHAHKKKAVKSKYVTFFQTNQQQIRTNVRVRVFNAGPLPRSQFASERSCDRLTRSTFSVVFLDPRANAELVPKSHVALHASHAALPLVTSKFRHNIALPMFYQISR